MEILNQILREAQSSPHTTLVIFDLDSTLFDLTIRMSSIADEFARTHQEQFPKECALLASELKLDRSDWGYDRGLKALGITQESHREFWQALHHFWHDAFFSNDYLHHDEPLPGAVTYVNELAKTGAHIMYLTGRDEPRMYAGTLASLASRGFPIPAPAPVPAPAQPNTQLVLKPAAGLDDAKWKVDVIKQIQSNYKKIYLFENEPVNTNLVAKELPGVSIIFVETTHSGREQAPPETDRIAHFERGK